MKALATLAISVLIVYELLWALGVGLREFTDAEWNFEESPRTGICYEVRGMTYGFAKESAMSPVDASYCEEGGGDEPK